MEKIPEKLLEALKKAAPEGKITCAQAHQIGRELEVSLIVVGTAANELGIKIKDCQLGCF